MGEEFDERKLVGRGDEFFFVVRGMRRREQ